MKFNQITETPISGIQAHDLVPDGYEQEHIDAGDSSPGERMHSFNDDRDWALVSRPAMQNRIVKMWKTSKYQFELLFLKLAISPHDAFQQASVYAGPMNTKQYSSFKTDLRKQGVTTLHWPSPKSNVITVLVFQHAEAMDRLTPWMVGHRIAHGIHAGDDQLENAVTEILEKYGVIDHYSRIKNGSMFTMRSVRDNKLRNGEELLHEILTQYIIKGSVLLKPEYISPMLAVEINKLYDEYFENELVGSIIAAY